MGWELEVRILNKVNEIESDVDKLRAEQALLRNLLTTLAQQSPVIAKEIASIDDTLHVVETNQKFYCEMLNTKLDELLNASVPSPVAAFKVTATAIEPQK